MMAALLLAIVVVNHPVADLFSRPSVEADVVSQAIYGTPVEVVETGSGWKRIRTPDGYTGWLDTGSIAVREQGYPSADAAGVQVMSLFAHLYRSRSVTAQKPLLTVPFETRLELVDQSDERWLEVRLVDGSQAWVQRGDVQIGKLQLDTPGVLVFSKRFVGLPYTWGGTSSFGYDCSGFTQMLMRQRGIAMPRDAHEQERWEGLRAVANSDLEPGDLLFFGPQPEKITHTGLYLGGGQFIHATAHLRPVVQISELDEPHWTERFQSARRPK